jgi:spore germination cell wall hydrolase CwlJ-like protein
MTRLISCFVAVFVLATHAYAERSLDPIMGLMRLDQQKFAALPHRDLGPVNAPKTDAGVYSKVYMRSLPVAKGGKEWACLTEALYFEARGETVKGQFAVAEVILNRVSSPSFPDTICGVINQGTGRKFACQFTYTCDGRVEVIREPKAYDMVGKVAKMVMEGMPRTLTDGATFYHTKAVRPSWARVFERTAIIGFHHFYKKPVRVSQN